MNGCLLLADFGSKVNRLMQPFHLRRVYYQLLQFYQMFEVITERDGMEVSCRWFLPKREKKAFAMIKLSIAVEKNTKAIRENGKAATEM